MVKLAKYFVGSSSLIFSCVLAGEGLGQTMQTENTMRLDAGSKSAPATLQDVSWLVGHWRGEGLGGQVEETWAPAFAGSMAGTFRLAKDGKLDFSEFFMMMEHEGSLVLKLKHFDREMHGWEEKDNYVTFPLVKVEGRTAWFSGLTYRLDESGTLHSIVAMKGKDDTFSEGVFKFRRVDK